MVWYARGCGEGVGIQYKKLVSQASKSRAAWTLIIYQTEIERDCKDIAKETSIVKESHKHSIFNLFNFWDSGLAGG